MIEKRDNFAKKVITVMKHRFGTISLNQKGNQGVEVKVAKFSSKQEVRIPRTRSC